MAAQAAVLPTAAAPVQSLDKTLPIPAVLPVPAPRLAAVEPAPMPAERPPAYSPPATLSVRHCSFQK